MFTLKAEDYWQWRFYLKEIELKTLAKRFKNKSLESMDKDLEILRLRMMAFKASLGEDESRLSDAKINYEEFKKTLELKYGQPIDGCVIDDVTFEVKRIEETNGTN